MSIHCGTCGCKSCRCPDPIQEAQRAAKKQRETDALLSDALSCLRGLVDTQALKEKTGKTEVYTRKRDHYWKEARRILKESGL